MRNGRTLQKGNPLHSDIHGIWPALLTPVGPDGTLDAARALAHAQRMLHGGSEGVTLFGTTGEGPAFTVAERQGLLESLLAGGIRPDQCVVTITALALRDAIDIGRHAAALGVVRQMLMPPFYFNQPRDAGLADAVSQVIAGINKGTNNGVNGDKLRLLLYHFPAMSTFGFSHPLIAELVRRHGVQIAGVKDSSGELVHSLALAEAFPGLSILVGAEPTLAPVLLAGGAGSINGLANIAPGLMHRIMASPSSVSAEDTTLMTDLLALLNLRPGMPFVGAYKVMLAEQTGDDFWLNMRAPLHRLEPDEEAAIRLGYRAIGERLQTV